LTLFWITAAVAAFAAIVAIAWPLLRPSARARSRAAHDEQVFRDQLAELERDIARGVLTADEAKTARLEVSRRLLAAAAEREKEAGPAPAPRRASRALMLALAIGVPLEAAVLYFMLAAPGYPDRPLALRLEDARRQTSQAAVEKMAASEGYDPAAEALAADPSLAEFAKLVVQLEQTVATRPNDLKGAQLLASSLRRLGRFAESWRAYARVIELSGDAATNDDYMAQVETMIFAAAGFVSEDAKAVAEAAVKRFGPSGTALYVSGLHAAQRGDNARAREQWTEALRRAPAGSSVAEAAQAQLAALGDPGGAGAPTSNAPGPTAGDMQAAAQMSDADRKAMIEGMVAGLGERLRAQGGDVNEWARLIRALGVLERPEEAKAAYDEAAAAFAGDPTALAFLKEQALVSGLSVE